MKKSLVFAAMACIAFASCTEDEIFTTNLNQEKAIAFSAPVVTKNTRAAVEDGTNYDNQKSFDVWGWWTAEEFSQTLSGSKVYINAANAVYDGNTWYPKNGDKLYYWPKNGYLTFLACSPADLPGVSADGKGITITDYVVNNVQSNLDMVDIMFSERVYNQTKDHHTATTGGYDGVDLTFRRALSSIVFNIKQNAAYTGTKITIESIKLKNVYKKATFFQNLNDKVDATTELPTTEGNSDPAVWVVSGATTDKVDYSVDDIKDYVLTTSPYWPSTKSTTPPAPYNGEGSPATTNAFQKTDFLLIPQSLNGVVLEIKYTIGSPDSDPLPQTYTYPFKANAKWEIGYRYTYNVSIGFDPITFAPIVDVYATTNASTDLPINKQN